MTPDEFIRKWKASTLTERSASHSHFLDLCALLEEATPTDSDQVGDTYTFEKGAKKTTGRRGWADVWKRGCFAWEYKGKHKDLTAAFAQLQQYATVLENPPLLVVSDMDRIKVHTNWTNTVAKFYEIGIEDLRDAANRATLKQVFNGSEKLKPGRTRQDLTEDVAREFAQLAWKLQLRGHEPQAVAHFVNRLVFCMFAEDVELLPNDIFKKMLSYTLARPESFSLEAQKLFSAMRVGGSLNYEQIPWFNGGLFDSDDALPLEKDDIKQVLTAAKLDWGQIEPSILGTLFERGLDPGKRGQLGAHYTDVPTIMKLIDPVIVGPLLREWEAVRNQAQDRIDGSKPASRTRARQEAERLCIAFLERLRRFRVLDPACGSGNFLYLSLVALKGLEHRVNLDIEEMGFTRQFPAVGPEAVQGIEINPYAAELARVSVWIGEIQWMRRNGFAVSPSPILKPLDTITCRDAVLNDDGTAAAWPAADAIVGNPPFLGGSEMIGMLGDDYTRRLRAAYAERLPAGSDLVCYWFENARQQLVSFKTERIGLVATDAIRNGVNRQTLDRMKASGLSFYEAWTHQPWVLDGAAVRVSLICLSKTPAPDVALNGNAVASISTNLMSGADVTQARMLEANLRLSFTGTKKGGPFDIAPEIARSWLEMPSNANGRTNADVVKPWRNGIQITRRAPERWIIDFGNMSEDAAAYYALPFAYVVKNVKPIKDDNRRDSRRNRWWLHSEVATGLRNVLKDIPRYIATSRISKHRVFVWLDSRILPDDGLTIIPRADDTMFGILHSRFHEAWGLRLLNRRGAGGDPRYAATHALSTFPFPDGLTPDMSADTYASDPRAQSISVAARELVSARERWLNPPELVESVPEVVAGFPERLVPKNAVAAATLRTRSLTALYNQRGTPEGAWLDRLHQALDASVAAAYGWPVNLNDDEALTQLLALNQARASAPLAA